jgi:dihydroorotate dehydrogenase (NAD+) catalytic subunit
MIELAPAHKRGLALRGPLLNAAGFLGFADEYRRLADFTALGAFVTNPLTARARTPAHGPRALEFPGGALIHTGLPNPGLRHAIALYRRKWAALPCPVIVHVAATTPAEVADGLGLLETVEGVAGVELGLKDGSGEAEWGELVAAAVDSSGLPVIVRVPFEGAAQAARTAREAGAVALTICAPPRGVLPGPDGRPVTGRLVGEAVFPLALRLVGLLAGSMDLPVIACGGITNVEAARAMLAAGAVAAQVDVAVWRDPQGLRRLADEMLDT